MNHRLSTFSALVLLGLGAAQGSAGAAAGLSPARGFVPREVIVKFEADAGARTVKLPAGVGVRRAAAVLDRSPAVAYAAPNYVASASAPTPFLTATGLPNDPGPIEGPPGPPGGWVSLQGNFLPWSGATGQLPTSPGGIDALGAWRNLRAAGRPGGRGAVVAVLDTGVAYRSLGKRVRRSPDFGRGQFVPGHDFVSGDRLPLDHNGHGTHVAGTIAESTDNGVGLVGLAHGARLMPVRVLDKHGSGEAAEIARGIRFAVNHGADVINMSFNFGCGKRVPSINEELRRAYRAGVVAVASIGNLGAETCVSPPATGPRVIGVGGTTEGGCLGSYSLTGRDIDLVAPGGGVATVGCPSVAARPIYQVTLRGGDTRRFGEPGSYVGTSMAAAHVSGLAALVLASRLLGPERTPAALVDRGTRRRRNTARDLGLPSTRQGAGLIDAGRATAPLP
ncbi:MAG TPA: S8 family serine peptidase [Solirubrobacterales bacterium]|nr:S8 family serine peptidase [Solirubrobacterales bacterium]